MAVARAPPPWRCDGQKIVPLDLGDGRSASLSDACTHLGAPAPTVTTHIQRLERDAGGQVLIRADRGQPVRLTAFGQAVLAAASSVPHLLEPGTSIAAR